MAKRKNQAIAWSPLRAIMKKKGAEVVSRDAVLMLLNYLEDRAKKLTEAAVKFAKHSKRKKVTQQDVELAISFM